ncbi:hypothetical protein LG047_15185 [Methylocystis sp. WRRC1]|uniref:hypothetical protein n=1 Tax=Methylocystis sp. WRRC1 TaxID=1732014 RepID=UPI001D15799F|nr:hypothetical protein [Methylocystis sp. WRRC1]MCC3246644.1 hypothetical protein [Methylocystis sp. WRRC1]
MSDDDSRLRGWLSVVLMIIIPVILAAGALIMKIDNTQSAHDAVHAIILDRIGEIEREIRKH